MLVRFWISVGLSLGWLGTSWAADRKLDFNRDVKPILSKNCFACHGPDDGHRSAGLRLDQRDSTTKKRKQGAVIVPGQPEQSLLIERITSQDEDEKMPPAETGNTLTAEQVQTLKDWIAQGAEYAPHWSFVKVQRPDLPTVQNKAWVQNPIDAFILAKLEKHGLKPAEPADKFLLLRRVSLDLRGLPPTLQEMEAFAKDTSPNAYEKMVDRFLADSSYGERWARMWLDLARYADSAGYGSDPLRPNMWRYRDWVMEAFNQNKPYDQFTIEQLAGDLLPEATLDQKIATAFHRNTMTNTEGGTDDEEFRVAAIKDRVDTTTQVWMGLTLGCAKCHNHKYDPLSQKEYYQFYAIFNQTADNDQPTEAPTIPATTEQIEKERQAIDQQIAALQKKIEQMFPNPAQELVTWEQELRVKTKSYPLLYGKGKTISGEELVRNDDGSFQNVGNGSSTVLLTGQTDGKLITGFRLDLLPDPLLAKTNLLASVDLNAFSGEQGKALQGRSVRIELPGNKKILSLAEVEVYAKGINVARQGTVRQSSTDFQGAAERAIDGNTNGNYYEANSVTHTKQEQNPWWELKLSANTTLEKIVVWNRTDGNTAERLTNFQIQVLNDQRQVVWEKLIAEAPKPSSQWSVSSQQVVRLEDLYAHDPKQISILANSKLKKANPEGWTITTQLDGPRSITYILEKPLTLTPGIPLNFQLHLNQIPRFRITLIHDLNLAKRLTLPRNIRNILMVPLEKRSKPELDQVVKQFLLVSPKVKPIRDEMTRLEKSRPEIPQLPVMVELPAKQQRKTRIMLKGDFLNLGEEVGMGLPGAFHSLPKEARLNRLTMAQWLVHPDNPLTARVAVNRFWSQIFGKGLVESEEDFGSQGELPTHPELLDFLATEYVRLGWDTKAFLKMLVLSATYQQSSRVTPELLQKDPKNQFYSRSPRYRLEAEMVRDQALAISGLLSKKIGGPSVYPPQPAGLWQAAFNGQRTWATSTGEDKYRRGLYTFWRRTVPYPSMATFDAPSRETCSIRRTRTNTPLQAFVTLNDPVFVEAAQALARRIVQEGGTSTEDRIRFTLKLALCRPVQDDRIQPLLELFTREKERFQNDPKAAKAMATDPLGPAPQGMNEAELAAWTVVANTVLNLDGVLSKN